VVSKYLSIFFMKASYMNLNLLRKLGFFASTSSLALVVACGGGGGGGVFNPSQAVTESFNAALAAIAASPANFSSFTNLLDQDYKQDGFTSADLRAMLAADAAALPSEASFPSVSYSDATISGCNTFLSVCDLSVTVTNNDADTVSTSMTLKVKQTVNGYKLIGDGSSS
jgi:hypothetical protein